MFNKRLSRRTVLRASGVSLALPFLEAMLPVGRSWAAPAPGARFAALYMGNGMLTGRGSTTTEDFFSCAGSPSGITTWSEPLQPLLPHKDYVTVVQNCSFTALNPSGDAGHEQAAPSFLTGLNVADAANAPPPTAVAYTVERLAGSGASLDRVIAAKRSTQLKSLMMAVGKAESGYVNGDSRLKRYMLSTISWESQTAALAGETIRSAQEVFDRLMASGLPQAAAVTTTTDQAALKAYQRKKSVLDGVTRDLVALERRLGAADKAVLAQYTDSVRRIEADLAALSSQVTTTTPARCAMPSSAAQAEYAATAVSYATITKTAELMIDLMALAFQCGITDVSTLMLSYDWSTIPTGQFMASYGVPNITGADHYHNASHYQTDGAAGGAALPAVKAINVWHTKRLAYLAQRFKATPDSDGRTLLDNAVVLFGAGMGDPDTHSWDRMVRVVLGKGLTLSPGPNGKLIDGQRNSVAHPKLLQTIANAFGVSQTIGLSGGATIGGIF